MPEENRPQRLRIWKIIAVDESSDGEGVAEFLVAAPDKSAARAAFLRHGLRGKFGPPATTERLVDIAAGQPGVVFKLDYRSGSWSPMTGRSE